jgi:hypothetical protein
MNNIRHVISIIVVLSVLVACSSVPPPRHSELKLPEIPTGHGRLIVSLAKMKGNLSLAKISIDDGEIVMPIVNGHFDYFDLPVGLHNASAGYGQLALGKTKYPIEILTGETIYVEIQWESALLTYKVNMRILAREEGEQRIATYILSNRWRHEFEQYRINTPESQ